MATKRQQEICERDSQGHGLKESMLWKFGLDY